MKNGCPSCDGGEFKIDMLQDELSALRAENERLREALKSADDNLTKAATMHLLGGTWDALAMKLCGEIEDALSPSKPGGEAE